MPSIDAFVQAEVVEVFELVAHPFMHETPSGLALQLADSRPGSSVVATRSFGAGGGVNEW